MQAAIASHLQWGRAHDRQFFCWLVDPDKFSEERLLTQLGYINQEGVDFIFVGGSLMMADALDTCVATIKRHTDIPVILFPGSVNQVNQRADGLLLLSLISGRNPDLLIGRHVEMAPILKQSNLEILSTGYMLVDAGQRTTAAYMSNTFPIPYQKTDIAVSTAMAGEMLGLNYLYLDAGSGASWPVHPDMIRGVKANTDVPLIVGGGMRSAADVLQAYEAGADMVVVGNAIEDNPALLQKAAAARSAANGQS